MPLTCGMTGISSWEGIHYCSRKDVFELSNGIYGSVSVLTRAARNIGKIANSREGNQAWTGAL